MKTTHFSLVQSLAKLDRRGAGRGEGRGGGGGSSRVPLQVFSMEYHREQFQHDQGRSLFDVVNPAFPLPINPTKPTYPTEKNN